MITFCKACDNPLASNAQFCGKCGAPVADTPEPTADHPMISEEPVALPIAGPAESPASVTQPLSNDSEPAPTFAADESEAGGRNWLFIGGAAAALLIIGALYYFLFVADDLGSSEEEPVAESNEAPVGSEQRLFAMTEANIRDKPTTKGSEILGKLPRGSAISGRLVNGSDDPTGTWLELSDGKGYVSMVNLMDFQPPELVKLLNNKVWTADGAVDIWKQPSSDSELLDRASEGTKLTLAGITANDYIEVKLKSGGVGYIADGNAIVARLGGKPVDLSFDPDRCSFGSEIDGLLDRLGAKIRSEYEAADQREYPDEEARNKALTALEGKSHYERIQRSWNGLSITAIGQHYESHSVYFAEPTARVIEVFREQGYRLDKEGNFPDTEYYAGVSGTRGETAAFGKADLGCGV